MGEKNERLWRKKSKRGVSPIIATILLVAITVVLAAVLYVLISGLTKGPGNTPLGTAYAWGPASTITGSATSAGCPTGKVCYSLEIASATSGLTGAGLTFSGRTSGGGAAPLTGYYFSLVSAAGANITTAGWAASGACAGAGCTTVLQSGMTIVLNTQGTTDVLAGDSIVAIGGGAFSGEVTSGSLT